MTRRLYYEDQYIREFSARIISCEKGEKGFEVVLDRTAFFPEGGGQPGDEGFIGPSRVTDTRERGGEVVHICSEELKTGVTAECRLNFEKRLLNMRRHAGEHIFSGRIHAVCGLDNVGFHMGEKSVTVDFNGPVSERELARAEREANEIVCKNVPVETFYPTEDELKNLEYRSKKEIKGRVRLARIEGADLCACCGTHPAFTGEIGIIKAVSMTNYKSGVRITLQIASQALEDYDRKNKSVYRISNLLCVKTDETAEAVERLIQKLDDSRFEASRLKREIFRLRAKDVRGGKICMFDKSGSAEDARIFSDILAEKAEEAAVFSGNDETGYKYAVTSGTRDVRPVGEALNASCSGRGGGKPHMVMGSVSATRAEIEKFWESLV